MSTPSGNKATMKSAMSRIEMMPETVTVYARMDDCIPTDIEIHVEPEHLFIGTKRQRKPEGNEVSKVRPEECSNWGYRCTDLPARIDPRRVRASVDNGELRIQLARVDASLEREGAAKEAA